MGDHATELLPEWMAVIWCVVDEVQVNNIIHFLT